MNQRHNVTYVSVSQSLFSHLKFGVILIFKVAMKIYNMKKLTNIVLRK